MNEVAASKYGQLVEKLGFSSLAKSLASDEDVLNGATPWTLGPYPQGFPPALIPLYVQHSGRFIGAWLHWGFADRKDCFVSFAGVTISGEPRMVVEIATTEAQLAYVYFIDALDGTGLEIDEDLEEDALIWGFDDIESLLPIMEEYPREPELLGLDAFHQNPPPLACYRKSIEKYSGDFPSRILVDDSTARSRASSYEVHSWYQSDEYELRRLISADLASPIWLRGTEQRPVFNSLMSQGDYSGAWMCLNSIGWEFADAQMAISELETHCSDPNFRLLIEAWKFVECENLASY
ncbi:MAG: hypothetical protein AAF394_16675 [Planctomycetota bacterium]